MPGESGLAVGLKSRSRRGKKHDRDRSSVCRGGETADGEFHPGLLRGVSLPRRENEEKAAP